MKHLLEGEKNIAHLRYIKGHELGPNKKARIHTYRENAQKALSSRTGIPRTWAIVDTLYLNKKISHVMD